MTPCLKPSFDRHVAQVNGERLTVKVETMGTFITGATAKAMSKRMEVSLAEVEKVVTPADEAAYAAAASFTAAPSP